jgi:hypothetical protein
MSEKDTENLLACVGVIIIIALIPLAAIFQGWVLTVLWGWFVAPTFNLPELSIATAIGLTLVVGMFKSYNINRGEKTTDDKIAEAIGVVLIPLLFLFFGWIVHLFM